MSLTVVQAAAGCGKTTDLARRYLDLIAEGVRVEETVAITFTRKAAAELQERVSLALRACLDGPAAERARARLGNAWPLYRAVAPTRLDLVRAALAGLPDAPIGTTDSFIQTLLAEMALDASLPLPGGGRVPLDVPVRAAVGLRTAFERAARRLLDPPAGPVDPDVALLTRYFGLDEILAAVCHRTAHDHLPMALAGDVFQATARALATVLARYDLAEIFRVGAPRDLDAWRAALDKETLLSGKWAVPAIAAWLVDGGRPEDAPHALAGWLRGLPDRGKKKEIRAAIRATPFDLGILPLDLWDVVDTLAYPYEDPEHVALADTLRAARERLRGRVVSAGLTEAATSGALGHDEFAEAAIALCEAPPPRLHGRFRALLVDEVQDANAAQLRLYRALASLPGPEPMRAWFVGDARQSIYLFRHAEPAGFHDLAAEAIAGGGRVVPLDTNHRSAPALVEAHVDLFEALAEPLVRAGLRPLDALAGLRGDRSNAHLGPSDGAPVQIVRGMPGELLQFRDADLRALDAFWGRVRGVWSDGPPDSAAVLAPTWGKAEEACERLRRWAGRDDIAYVEGGSSTLGGRVATDLLFMLRALLDGLDDVAWLGVWKHPAVGLTDAALARIRAGVGLHVRRDEGWTEAAPWTHGLGTAIDADRLTSPHDPIDQLAFGRALGPLRSARAQIGRGETAEVLDRLVTSLGWRTVYAAGPGGDDDLATLEVLIDHIRTLAADGVDPHGIVAALADDRAVEAPVVHLDRPARAIACTTVFQAKGRAWDHVLVLSPGRPPRAVSGPGTESEPVTTWMRVPGGAPARLSGLKFDPTGGLSPFKEPLARLAARIEQRRSDEECVRLAYVALTRARRSVTFGLPDDPKGCATVQKLLATVWGAEGFGARGTRVVRRSAPPPLPGLPPGWASPSPGATFTVHVPTDRTWQERAPSGASAQLTSAQRLQVAEWIVPRVVLANGLHRGGSSNDPVHEERYPPTFWGDVAHGWLATWQFRGPVTPSAVRAYLVESWKIDDPDVVDWLRRLCDGLAQARGPLWNLVTQPDARLRFELPFVGCGQVSGQDLLLSGRIDLLVEHKRAVTLIDFKAGPRSPSSLTALVDGANLRTYGPQIEGYRDALVRMGHAVESVALWFVRTGTSVRW